MSNAILETLRNAESLSKDISSVCVGFSGGKDSIVTYDICKRFFPEVSIFYMYMIPDLDYVNQEVAIWEAVLKTKCHQIPHHAANYWIKNEFFAFPSSQRASLPDITIEDCLKMAKAVSGAGVVATGAKKSDGAWRTMWLEKKKDKYFFPLKNWKKADVQSYMLQRGLKPPSSNVLVSANNGGITASNICRLHDTYPNDYQKFLKVFPLLGAYIKHRELYGETKTGAERTGR